MTEVAYQHPFVGCAHGCSRVGEVVRGTQIPEGSALLCELCGCKLNYFGEMASADSEGIVIKHRDMPASETPNLDRMTRRAPYRGLATTYPGDVPVLRRVEELVGLLSQNPPPFMLHWDDGHRPIVNGHNKVFAWLGDVSVEDYDRIMEARS